jgi:hypothetical protein
MITLHSSGIAGNHQVDFCGGNFPMKSHFTPGFAGKTGWISIPGYLSYICKCFYVNYFLFTKNNLQKGFEAPNKKTVVMDRRAEPICNKQKKPV